VPTSSNEQCPSFSTAVEEGILGSLEHTLHPNLYMYNLIRKDTFNIIREKKGTISTHLSASAEELSLCSKKKNRPMWRLLSVNNVLNKCRRQQTYESTIGIELLSTS